MSQAYVLATIGGLFIGSAAILMLLFLGRIAGISGILKQAFFYEHGSLAPENIWRWFFIAGILLGGYLVHAVGGIPMPKHIPENYLLVAAAGLLVGYGVSVGSGCTSGHGICGVSRLSIRSIVATITFMAAGIITVAITRHVI